MFNPLPNTPSAEVVENQGLELGSTAKNHQEKIEEVFLHLIEDRKCPVENRIREFKKIKTMSIYPKWSINWFLIFVLASCKNPCKEVYPVKATFTMTQEVYGGKVYPLENGDTIRKAGEITFIADEAEAADVSFEWKVGTDNRVFTKKKFTLEFDVNETIQVRLITKKQPNLDCFPLDDGMDTTTQTFTAIDSTVLLGDYGGFNKSNPQDTFTVKFIKDKINDWQYVDNLPKGCIRTARNWTSNNLGYGYNIAVIGHINDTVKDCPGIFGFAQLAKDNRTLTIDYTFWDDAQKRFITEQFMGVKK